jgi:hypothetical protein
LKEIVPDDAEKDPEDVCNVVPSTGSLKVQFLSFSVQFIALYVKA